MSPAVVLAPPPPPGLQEAIKNSTTKWQQDLESLFKHAKDRFPDVVWELTDEVDEDEEGGFNVSFINGYESDDRRRTVMTTLNKAKVEEVWGHKAIVYARAPPSFQSRYFSFRNNPSASMSPLPYSSDYHTADDDDQPYPAESAVSLIPRTPSPSPTTSQLLRITTSINPALFSNELEFLYTAQRFGEAFEFLFDSSEYAGLVGVGENGEEEEGLDPEALRIDKLRKDLVFMWRSRLYSDIRIALTGNFASSNGTHENTTAIFSSHRFMLVSRSPYFHSALLGFSGPAPAKTTGTGEPPTLTLPSPPFTPASLHFTLGFIYTGTLIFSHRTFDLSTAFAILRASDYLGLDSLHDEIQARIAHEMLHGLFHAFLPFAEYEKLTQSKWGVGGCRCRQCARRAPRVLEFSLAEDVKNAHLERGSRRALVGLFGEGWCTQEFAGLPQKIRESLLKGLAKRTTPQNIWALLWAAEGALVKLGPVVEPWGDVVRENVFGARKVIDEVLCRESEECFARDEWSEVVENEGVGFSDTEKVEWVMAAVLRGVKEPWAATLYQTLVSSILLRPHPTEENAPLLSATSQIRVQVEQTRLELLKWIGKRWISIRQEQGFDQLEGWALKEISDHIEVPIEDLLNPSGPTKASQQRAGSPGQGFGLHHQQQSSSSKGRNAAANPNSNSGFLRPFSQHPHTSRIDADSDGGISMRASVLTRNSTVSGRSGRAPTRGSARGAADQATVPSYASSLTPSRRRGGGNESIASSLRSTGTFESGESRSTVGPPRKRTTTGVSVASSAVSSRTGTGSFVSSFSRTGGDGAEDGGDGEDDGGDRDGAGDGDGDGQDSPAKRIAASVRNRMKLDEKLERERERPDSKLTPSDLDLPRTPSPTHPSIIESNYDSEGRTGEGESEDHEDDGSDKSVDGDSTGTAGARSKVTEKSVKMTPPRLGPRKQTLSNASTSTAPLKKTVVPRASLASVNSRTTTTSASTRPKSSASSIRSVQTNSGARKVSGGSANAPANRSPVNTRPSSRVSTRTTSTTNTHQSRTTASSRSTLSTISSGRRSSISGTSSRPTSRPTSRLSTTTASTATGGRPASSVSSATDMTYRTASAGGNSTVSALTTPVTPTARTRKISAASTVSNASTRTTTSVAGVRGRKISTGSVSSVASARSPISTRRGERAPPVPPIDPTKLSPAAARKAASTTGGIGGKGKGVAPSLRSAASTASLASTVSKRAPFPVKKVASSPAGPVKSVAEPDVDEKEESKREDENENDTIKIDLPTLSPKEQVDALPPPTPAMSVKSLDSSVSASSAITAKSSGSSATASDHKKSSSSASVSSVATLTMKKRDSVDTITSRHTNKSKESPASSSQPTTTSTRASSPPLPALPQQDEELAERVPQGATLDIGIPCIVSSKRKRFKAYARYIGEVQGELGPWVGVEVPMPSWEGAGYGYSVSGGGATANAPSDMDDQQWHDGSWGGIRYFEISNHGSDGWGDDRASRRRRIDAGSVGGAVWGHHTGGSSYSSSMFGRSLKREGDSLSVGADRLKKMRSVSPTVSETSSMIESRGLFVRPQQVLYVVDAVGADL